MRNLRLSQALVLRLDALSNGSLALFLPRERAVTLAAGVGSALGAGVLAVWLAAGETGADTHGLVALWSVAAFLAVAAVAHAAVLILGRGS